MPNSSDKLTYLCGAEIDAGEFPLSLVSDNFEPAQITGLLEMKLTESHRRDSAFGHGCSYGYGERRFSTGRLDFRIGKPFEEQFDEFMRRLPASAEAWESIAAVHAA